MADSPTSKEKEVLKVRKFNVCEHEKDIQNYCLQCELFICDECCTDEHLEHIEAVETWDAVIQHYHQTCRNCTSRTRVLIKTTVSEEQLKKELFTKIEDKFQEIHQKIEEYKGIFKQEMWSLVKSERLFNNTPELTAMLEKLQVIEDDIQRKIEGEDKEGLLDIMREGALDPILTQLDSNKERKTVSLQYSKLIREFSLHHDKIDYDFCRQGISAFTPYYEENRTRKYFFPNGARIWRKVNEEGEEGFKSMCCPTPLPKHWRISLRKSKGEIAYIGFSGKDFLIKNDKLGVKKGEWAIGPEGETYQGGLRDEGEDPILDVEDITIIYDQNHQLHLNYGGKTYQHYVQGLQGQAYLCAALYEHNSFIEITQVTKLA